MQQVLERYAREILEHPMMDLDLSPEMLRDIAVIQYNDSITWVGGLALIRDRATSPALRKAVHKNALCELGDLNTQSHLTMCLRFIQSLGISPGGALARGVPPMGEHAVILSRLFTRMTNVQLCGWMLGTEALVPKFFTVLHSHYLRTFPHADFSYLGEHVRVDADEHARWMEEAAQAVLAENPANITGLLFGIRLAGRFIISVMDATWAMA